MRKAIATITGMAMAVALAIPVSAFMPSHELRRVSTCMYETGRSYEYCKLGASERRAHDERERRQKEREAQERRARAAQEWLNYQMRSGDSCRFGGC